MGDRIIEGGVLEFDPLSQWPFGQKKISKMSVEIIPMELNKIIGGIMENIGGRMAAPSKSAVGSIRLGHWLE